MLQSGVSESYFRHARMTHLERCSSSARTPLQISLQLQFSMYFKSDYGVSSSRPHADGVAVVAIIHPVGTPIGPGSKAATEPGCAAVSGRETLYRARTTAGVIMPALRSPLQSCGQLLLMSPLLLARRRPAFRPTGLRRNQRGKKYDAKANAERPSPKSI